MGKNDENGSWFWVKLLFAVLVIFIIALLVLQSFDIHIFQSRREMFVVIYVWTLIFSFAVIVRSVRLLKEIFSRSGYGIDPVRMINGRRANEAPEA